MINEQLKSRQTRVQLEKSLTYMLRKLNMNPE